MMVEFRRTQVLLILLQITDAVSGNETLYVAHRDGAEVTLPCDSLMDDQENCDSTEWLFTNSRSRRAVVLFKDGKIVVKSKDKSDRLSVSEKCSLVIKNVTDEDVGQYGCRQFRSSQTDAVVYLSVVTLTEHKDAEEVTVICSVSSYEGCRHTVKWLLEGQDVDKDNKEVMTSQSSCSSNVTFKTSHVVYTSKNSELLKCEVTTDQTEERKLFPFSPPQSSDWWPYAVVAVGSAALLVLVAAVGRWITTRASKKQVDDSIALTSNPAETQPPPEGRQDPVTSHPAGAEPEGVFYASVSHTGKTDGAAKVRGGEDAVTYSSVNLPSTDGSNLYATVNPPQM